MKSEEISGGYGGKHGGQEGLFLREIESGVDGGGPWVV